MTSIIERLRHWARGAENADTVAVRIYRNGHLVARRDRIVVTNGKNAGSGDVGTYNAANAITAALLGAARREAKGKL